MSIKMRNSQAAITVYGLGGDCNRVLSKSETLLFTLNMGHQRYSEEVLYFQGDTFSSNQGHLLKLVAWMLTMAEGPQHQHHRFHLHLRRALPSCLPCLPFLPFPPCRASRPCHRRRHQHRHQTWTP